MFKTIVVPVDLAHKEALSKALCVARDLARTYSAKYYIVGVTAKTPSARARTPEEYKARLGDYAKALGEDFGIDVHPYPVTSHDLAVDLERDIINACDTLGADLVVMASHVPGLAEYVFSSNAGYLASHAKISVFVVR
ncbi:MAG: universal stress protein [Paracoccaceae bacterium]